MFSKFILTSFLFARIVKVRTMSKLLLPLSLFFINLFGIQNVNACEIFRFRFYCSFLFCLIEKKTQVPDQTE